MREVDMLLETLKAINWTDIAKRALWTFVQAFLAVFIIAGESIIDLLFNADWQALSVLLIATLVSALAAGLSAIKSIVLEVLHDIRNNGGVA